MVTPAPASNLPPDSMKWGRWASDAITDHERRLDNLEQTISNLNKALNAVRNGLS